MIIIIHIIMKTRMYFIDDFFYVRKDDFSSMPTVYIKGIDVEFFVPGIKEQCTKIVSIDIFCLNIFCFYKKFDPRMFGSSLNRHLTNLIILFTNRFQVILKFATNSVK